MTDTHPPLLPCPYCGREGKYDLYEPMVYCAECGVEMLGYSTPAEAAAAWNTRHPDPATLALARLGAAYFSPTLGEADITAVAALNTPGVRERIAELLGEEGA